ncbi:MAG: M23 family metallopeptidase [Prevotella sp.]|nr:M23 family metallopeptidase [Prevotella sp.]
MNRRWLYIIICVGLAMLTTASMPIDEPFTAAEQQSISVETPGLFDKSSEFTFDFGALGAKDYSFPLPVGKAELTNNQSELLITTTKGDAVKAMFAGVVRLSKNISGYGNVIVIRHDNGMETVYAHNAQNLVRVKERVSAGQTIAIVGGDGKSDYCNFMMLVNGARINPATIIEMNSHRLRKQVVKFRKKGSLVAVSVVKAGMEDVDMDKVVTINLAQLPATKWAYPLPGSHVISPYGGSRRHSGVDIKTVPNDKILAAFDGEVTRSEPYYGYGNCIRIRHANGFETLYSHQSKNLVKVGQKVKAGQVIGLTGRTGRATIEHLHFELFYAGKRYDPAFIFDHANHSLQNVTITLANGRMTSKKNI